MGSAKKVFYSMQVGGGGGEIVLRTDSFNLCVEDPPKWAEISEGHAMCKNNH